MLYPALILGAVVELSAVVLLAAVNRTSHLAFLEFITSFMVAMGRP